MIVSTSLIRRRDDVTLRQFKSHWLSPHGPLTAALPGTLRYDQNHTIPDAMGTNAAARTMRIDGFPILAFGDADSRRAAHTSPQMSACNEDSRQFIGAVSRLISDIEDQSGPDPQTSYIKQIFVLPRPASPHDLETVIEKLEGLVAVVRHSIVEQGGAPNSTVPFIGIDVAGLAEVWIHDAVSIVRNAAIVSTSLPALATFEVEVHHFF